MPYLLEGLLRAYLCDDCIEPLSDVTVRIYRAIDRKPQVPVLTHVPEEKPEALTEEQVEEKRPLLLGEGRTDAEGRYRVAIDPQARYEGGPLEVDIYCTTVPRLRDDKRERKPVQFTAAVIDPEWQRAEGGATANWSYILPHRLWCFIRSLFDAWVICGHLVDCASRKPIAGVTVRAFDADWLQDDSLGQDTTDAGGHFRIDYTSAQFRKTPFSPWINVELTEGPDLYFKVEQGGTTLLGETQADGRRRGRENVGHCYCVTLCVEGGGGDPYLNPFFTSVGNLEFMSDVDAGTGLANKSVAGSAGVGFGFFGSLQLGGLCPAKKPGTSDPMFYRFRVALPGVADAAAAPVTAAQVTPVRVGWRLISWDQDGDGVAELRPQAVWVQGAGATPGLPAPPAVPPGTPWGAPPKHVIVPDADGWIPVDPDATGHVFQGALLSLNSAAAGIVPGGSSGGSGVPGQPPTTPRNGRKIRVLFDTATDPSNAATIETQTDVAVLLVNNWPEVGELGCLQFHSGGGNACSGLDSALDIEYTTDHELMAAWSVGISSAAFSMPGAPANPSPIVSGPDAMHPRGDNGTEHLDISTWPSCSYVVILSTQRKLTDGISNDPSRTSGLFTFCIDREGGMHP